MRRSRAAAVGLAALGFVYASSAPRSAADPKHEEAWRSLAGAGRALGDGAALVPVEQGALRARLGAAATQLQDAARHLRAVLSRNGDRKATQCAVEVEAAAPIIAALDKDVQAAVAGSWALTIGDALDWARRAVLKAAAIARRLVAEDISAAERKRRENEMIELAVHQAREKDARLAAEGQWRKEHETEQRKVLAAAEAKRNARSKARRSEQQKAPSAAKAAREQKVATQPPPLIPQAPQATPLAATAPSSSDSDDEQLAPKTIRRRYAITQWIVERHADGRESIFIAPGDERTTLAWTIQNKEGRISLQIGSDNNFFEGIKQGRRATLYDTGRSGNDDLDSRRAAFWGRIGRGPRPREQIEVDIAPNGLDFVRGVWPMKKVALPPCDAQRGAGLRGNGFVSTKQVFQLSSRQSDRVIFRRFAAQERASAQRSRRVEKLLRRWGYRGECSTTGHVKEAAISHDNNRANVSFATSGSQDLTDRGVTMVAWALAVCASQNVKIIARIFNGCGWSHEESVTCRLVRPKARTLFDAVRCTYRRSASEKKTGKASQKETEVFRSLAGAVRGLRRSAARVGTEEGGLRDWLHAAATRMEKAARQLRTIIAHGINPGNSERAGLDLEAAARMIVAIDGQVDGGPWTLILGEALERARRAILQAATVIVKRMTAAHLADTQSRPHRDSSQ